MNTRLFVFAGVMICAVCVMAGNCFADGLVVIEDPMYLLRILPNDRAALPPIVALPVKYHRVTVTINNGVATTLVDQVFKNEFDVDVEGTYMFPIPEDAAITEFSLYVDGEKLSGQVLDKDIARRTYEDIVRRMKDPGLLEYAGRNMFKARIYPIPKHGEKRIQLSYQQAIPYAHGVYTYNYPLDTERFSPKPLEEVVISVKVSSLVPIKSVYSPSHEIRTSVKKLSATCSYEANDVVPDKNFILHYSVSEKDLGLSLLCSRKPHEDGYFMFFVSPGELEVKAQEKDVVFVLDTSGSMQGKKLDQARGALRYCVNSLSKGDRFSLISFASTIEQYTDTMAEVNDANIAGALSFIEHISASGGTNIHDALLTALGDFSDSRRPRMIVFLTDGEPTEGIVHIQSIIEDVSKENRVKTRIFVFGVGDNVNTHFLDKLSEVNRGASEYVLPKEDIEEKVSSFFRKVSEPVMSDVKLDFGKSRVFDIYPVTLPDIFNGAQLTVMGRYSGEGPVTATLKGIVDGKEKTFTYEGEFSKTAQENDFVPRLWATRKIGHLMSEIRFKQENKELVDEIVRLSKEFGIITPYTSFFIAEKESFAPSAPQYDYYTLSNETRFDLNLSKGLYGQSVGSGAVRAAQHIAGLKEATSVSQTLPSSIKHAGGKTFYQRTDGYWVDSKFKEGDKTKDIKFMSPEYLMLSKADSGINKYYAVAQKIIFVFEGINYRVIE
jgi:Ca-activated chloride channel homolog